MSQLEGKVAIVTSAARGLGRAYAEAMAREGIRLDARRPDGIDLIFHVERS